MEEFPFLVALERNSSFICGGSILSPWHIITAAHCFGEDVDPSSYRIRAGSSVRETGGLEHQVRELVIHEDFKSKLYSNVLDYDLALLKLEKPIALDNKTTREIRMFNSGELIVDGIRAFVAGWGVPLHGKNYSEQVRSVELRIVDRQQCDDRLKNSPMRVFNRIREGKICAGSETGSTSGGDSGGPLVIGGRLAGTVSAGSKMNLPNIFTNVAYFRDWIDERIAEFELVSS